MQTCTLAVDIGASSGRHIVGTVQNGKITLQEVYRFENGVHRENGHLCWDIDTLAKEVVNGLKAAHDAGFAPATIGIDTWAVDFVLLDADNKRIGDAVAYRDERTEGIREALEKEYGLTFADHYARTGIQYQPFNTVYQLMALKKEHPEQLAAAKTFLMVPDYLNYLLCGVPANEYTNASTTALVGADSRDWDDALIEKLGLPRGIFQPIKTAGTVLGHLTPEIQKAVGFDAEVILPATHDTGSAFLAVPARDEYAAYLSSGTWSLLGVENAAAITGPDSCAANFTNEGGYEYRYRYLKNIMGLWMIQSVRRELGEKTGTRPSFPELIAAAKEAADFPSCVDPDDNRFLAPASMIEEVRAACADTHQPVPAATGEVMQCVYNSLTQDYRRAVETLQSLTGKTYTSLNIVGGGSQDGYLNQQTANATGLTVFAGPTEGTALGNLMVQFIHSGDFADLAEARAAADAALTMREPLDVVNVSLIPALDAVGDGFEKGTVFLPQLLQAATAAQAAFEAIKAKIAASGQAQGSKGKIVIATVKGDVHDIGKNIVRVILENYGYDVLDLGRDVDPERVVEAVRQTGAKLVGLSALMTTTVPNMQATIEALHAAHLDCKVMVGGAVLTPDYARDIGADYYCKDAKASADLAKQLLG